MSRNTIAATLMLVTVLVPAFAGRALAADSSDTITQSQTIRYGDLNLSQERGAKALLVRIRRAAIAVCTPPGERNEHGKAFWGCVYTATNQAVAEVNRPMVSILHGRRLTQVAEK
jgi:UrcA family protein